MTGLIYEDIAQEIREQLVKKDNYADMHYYHALFLGYWGQYSEALTEINRSLDLNPRYRKALEFKEALETMIHRKAPVPADSPNPHPVFHETHNYAALYYGKKKRFETAEDCIEKSYALSKNESDYQLQLGMLYEMKGDLFQAAGHLEKAIELDVDSWKPYSNLCHIYTLQDRLEDARNIMRQVVEKYPLYPDLHYHLALLLIESGEFSEAIEQFKKAVDINPKYYYAQYHLGTAYLLNNQPKEAETQFLLMIDKGWEPEGIFLDIARSQLEAGKWDAAEQSSVRAMERDPSNPEPYYLMSQICALKKDTEGASHYSTEAKKREFSL
jgi:tetratricopeptide (TPR) repeat protein